MKGSCTVMIIYLVVTMTVFITLFSSLQDISNFKIKDQFETLQATYNASYEVEYLEDYLNIDLQEYYASENKADFIQTKETEKIASDPTTFTEDIVLAKKNECIANAQEDVVIKYDEIKDSWLWVKNIWRPDSPTASQILNHSEFVTATGLNISEQDYNNVMGKLFTNPETSGVNGYYILSIIVVVVSFLSQWLTRKLSQPKSKDGATIQQPGMAKILMFILPFAMLMFTISSSAMFAIYIITNSVVTTLINPLTTFICNKIEDKIEKKKKEQNKAEYSR